MDIKPVYLFLIAFIVIIIGIVVIQESSDNVEAMEYSESSSSQNFTATSLNPILSPVGEGIISSSVQTYNQTWLDFDGVDDKVDIGNVNSINNSMGISVWVYLNKNDTTYYDRLIGKGNNYHIEINPSTQRPYFRAYGDANNFTLCPSAITVETWHNIIGYYDAQIGNYGCCLDGVCAEQNKNSGVNLTTNTNAFQINPGSVADINGSILSVSLWNRRMGQNESYFIYNKLESYNTNTSSFKEWNDLGYAENLVTKEEFKFTEIGNVLYNKGAAGIYKWVTSAYIGTYDENNVSIIWANSSDGITWTKQGYLIGQKNQTEDPYIVYNGSTFFLYTENKNNTVNISLYTSVDFINWNFVGDILKPEETWESQDVSSPAVIFENGVFTMFYEGRNSTQSGMIGVATSSDGITWIKNIDNPVLIPAGSGWEIQSTVPDDVLKINNLYYITYHAYNGSTFNAGYFVTKNLTNKNDYIKYFDNPLPKNDTLADIMFFNKSGEIKLVGLYSGGLRLIHPQLSLPYRNDFKLAEYKLNSNNGTTAYDSSGNSNHGTISGATWQNDGILVNLIEGVDYNLNTATGLLTLSTEYLYDWIITGWRYGEKGNSSATVVGRLIPIFVAITILAFIFLIINYYIKEVRE